MTISNTVRVQVLARRNSEACYGSNTDRRETLGHIGNCEVLAHEPALTQNVIRRGTAELRCVQIGGGPPSYVVTARLRAGWPL